VCGGEEMTEEQVNIFFYWFQNIIPLKQVWDDGVIEYYCLTDKEDGFGNKISSKLPDFFTDSGFGILRKWMEENKSELWESYLYWVNAHCYAKTASEGLNRILNPANLVQFLVQNRNSWEMKKCISCPDSDRSTHPGSINKLYCRTIMNRGLYPNVYRKENDVCWFANRQHPAAKYLDNLYKEDK